LRRRGLIDVYIDILIIYVVMLVLTALCISVIASHVGV